MLNNYVLVYTDYTSSSNNKELLRLSTGEILPDIVPSALMSLKLSFQKTHSIQTSDTLQIGNSRY